MLKVIVFCEIYMWFSIKMCYQNCQKFNDKQLINKYLPYIRIIDLKIYDVFSLKLKSYVDVCLNKISKILKSRYVWT